ncbi:MAG TPA: hypothetical protein VM577_14970 [Anaerovoracaceae bacterium]|nr:hypothetical protein [Anaerovoracaceae bacterium]
MEEKEKSRMEQIMQMFKSEKTQLELDIEEFNKLMDGRSFSQKLENGTIAEYRSVQMHNPYNTDKVELSISVSNYLKEQVASSKMTLEGTSFFGIADAIANISNHPDFPNKKDLHEQLPAMDEFTSSQMASLIQSGYNAARNQIIAKEEVKEFAQDKYKQFSVDNLSRAKASYKGDYATVEMLRDFGKELDAYAFDTSKSKKDNAFEQASKVLGKKRKVEDIAKIKDLDINHQIDEKTLLHTFIEKGNVSAVKKLIELGADVNAKGVMGDTPLHTVYGLDKQDISFKDRQAIAELLEAAGADFSMKNRKGQSIYQKAFSTGWIAQELDGEEKKNFLEALKGKVDEASQNSTVAQKQSKSLKA